MFIQRLIQTKGVRQMSYYRRYDIALLLRLEWTINGKVTKRTMRFPHLRFVPDDSEFQTFAETMMPLIDAERVSYAAWQEDHVVS